MYLCITAFDCHHDGACHLVLDAWPAQHCFSESWHVALAALAFGGITVYFPAALVARGYIQLFDAEQKVKHQQRYLFVLCMLNASLQLTKALLTSFPLAKLLVCLVSSLTMLSLLLFYFKDAEGTLNACTYPPLIRVKIYGYCMSLDLTIGALVVWHMTGGGTDLETPRTRFVVAAVEAVTYYIAWRLVTEIGSIFLEVFTGKMKQVEQAGSSDGSAGPRLRSRGGSSLV